MPQKTLDNKTDCRKSKSKGTCTIRYSGNNAEIEKGIQSVHKKYPCVKIRVNGKVLQEDEKEWGEE